MYIETKIILQGLIYAMRSDGPHQQVLSDLVSALQLEVATIARFHPVKNEESTSQLELVFVGHRIAWHIPSPLKKQNGMLNSYKL